MYRQFGEASVKVTNWVTDPLDGSMNVCEKFVLRGITSRHNNNGNKWKLNLFCVWLTK